MLHYFPHRFFFKNDKKLSLGKKFYHERILSNSLKNKRKYFFFFYFLEVCLYCGVPQRKIRTIKKKKKKKRATTFSLFKEKRRLQTFSLSLHHLNQFLKGSFHNERVLIVLFRIAKLYFFFFCLFYFFFFFSLKP